MMLYKNPTPDRFHDKYGLLRDRYLFTLIGAIIVAFVLAFVLFANAMEARSCGIAQHQYKLHTHYVFLDDCYVTPKDGQTMSLDQYQSVHIEGRR